MQLHIESAQRGSGELSKRTSRQVISREESSSIGRDRRAPLHATCQHCQCRSAQLGEGQCEMTPSEHNRGKDHPFHLDSLFYPPISTTRAVVLVEACYRPSTIIPTRLVGTRPPPQSTRPARHLGENNERVLRCFASSSHTAMYGQLCLATARVRAWRTTKTKTPGRGASK